MITSTVCITLAYGASDKKNEADATSSSFSINKPKESSSEPGNNQKIVSTQSSPDKLQPVSSENGLTSPAILNPLEINQQDQQDVKIESLAKAYETGNYAENSLNEVELPPVTVVEKMVVKVAIPSGINKVLIANPEVVSVYTFDKGNLRIYGRKTGLTSIIVIGKNKSYRFNVDVKHDIKNLENIIKTLYPTEQITLKSIPGAVLLLGHVSSNTVVKDIQEVLSSYLQNDRLINKLKLTHSNQVALQVKIAEVKRDALNNIGVSWFGQHTTGKFRWGILRGRNPISSGLFTSGASVSGASPGSIGTRFVNRSYDFAAILDMLEDESLASVLAEPTLVTLSGEAASFLAGGEFPYPVPQSNAGANTVEFKPYGVGLYFVATEMGDNKIRLEVRTEVSDVDSAVQSGTTPGISTRRASTFVELNEGETLVIAGLLHDSSSTGISSVPALGDLPILGALFRSSNFRSRQSELVVAVTVHMVEPIGHVEKLTLPNDGLKFANTISRVFGPHLTEPKEAKKFTKEVEYKY
ncbi:MAG: pilus assembly protein N-terminal domain-containing protein [Proteobacteria bacterium]|nr:pilus assembly protein N-terminal domain-containing protein [Pseudomonadota bacterium]